jgi:hypothetical protein
MATASRLPVVSALVLEVRSQFVPLKYSERCHRQVVKTLTGCPRSADQGHAITRTPNATETSATPRQNGTSA